MARYLLIFKREQTLRWLSHLEETRALERALRRTGLPLIYSQGFSPRPQINYGPPIPVGFSSQAQWLELRFSEIITPETIMEKINNTLPEGFKLLEVELLSENHPSLGSYHLKISYVLLVEGNGLNLAISSFLSQSYYQVLREGKPRGKEKLFNIRPFVLELSLIESEEIKRYLSQNQLGDILEENCLVDPKYQLLFLSSLYTSSGSVKMMEIEKALNAKIINGKKVSIKRYG